MSADVLEQLAQDLTDRVVDFLNRQLIEAMSDESVAKFEDLLDGGRETPQLIRTFINDHVPNKEQVTAKSLVSSELFTSVTPK
jgi:hypothetical protein